MDNLIGAFAYFDKLGITGRASDADPEAGLWRLDGPIGKRDENHPRREEGRCEDCDDSRILRFEPSASENAPRKSA